MVCYLWQVCSSHKADCQTLVVAAPASAKSAAVIKTGNKQNSLTQHACKKQPQYDY